MICDIVHCEWNEWIIGECSKSCGGGTRVNERTEKVTAQHGGDKCPGPTSIEESCNVQECPGKRCPIGFQFYTVLYDMARQLTTQNVFQLIVNGVTGNMEIVLQRVEMA